MSDIEKNVEGGVLVDDDNFGTETGSLKNRAVVTAPTFEQDIFAAQADRDDGDYVEFRTMGWVQAGFVALAEGIALGTLSFPSIFMRLGIFGGVVATVGLGALAWLAASWMVDFKKRFPGELHSVGFKDEPAADGFCFLFEATMNYADAAFVIYGRWGYRICAAGMVAKPGVTKRPLSTAFAPTELRTIISVISVTCIITASFITVVATGVQPESHLMKAGKPIVWYAFNRHATLSDVIGALTNICFTYGGGMACFTFASEMKNPDDFKKSYALVQIGSVIVYVLVGCLIYVFGGQFWWVGIVIGMWIVGWVLAELIPFFNSLLTIGKLIQ
ncbi:hypothetical protein QFC19_003961 [Naganishia cerealis]|uniref:Uncharacterized protein n=1 Tax=Naganishia cerealis TaxID=610337 RepID=A0ACC2W0C0_9TREE|nr:hypothetical protein QFC19_003961 [Naganishia cerealis]